ncbi:CcdB family protein [Rhizobacter sp. LjRoot28]|uniref:CcdB family protein n=1 Tax=Rhizobacter sp. LjRoot28 TaxID=3342309 RepID=UPI003F5046FF
MLDKLKTRIVVPLMPEGSSPKPAKGLNPVFTVAGEDHLMVTQFLAAVPVSALESEVASLASDDATIVGALDFLFQGI